MTEKERLQKIKESWGVFLDKEDGMCLVSVEDFKWLVEYVEGAETQHGMGG